jgi:hypothetical protein
MSYWLHATEALPIENTAIRFTLTACDQPLTGAFAHGVFRTLRNRKTYTLKDVVRWRYVKYWGDGIPGIPACLAPAFDAHAAGSSACPERG